MSSRSLNALMLLAPVAVLGLFGWLSSRHSASEQADAATLNSGPFKVSIKGIEKIPVTPIDLFEGYDTKFRLIFEGRGKKPRGWGNSSSFSSGGPTSPWTFFTERQGQHTHFTPSKIEAWTTRYDQKRGLYYNEVLLHTGPLTTETALKVKGSARIDSGSAKFGSLTPFEATLKAANTPWKAPVVSTDPGCSVQSVNVVKNSASERSARIRIYVPTHDISASWQGSVELMDAHWQPFHHIERGNNPWKGCWMAVTSSFGPDSDMSPYPSRESERVQKYAYTWSNAEIAPDKARDVIAVAHLSFNNRWPLEVAFHIKKDGKPTFGTLPLLQRPKPVR